MRRNIVYICAKSAVSERRDYYEVLGVDRGERFHFVDVREDDEFAVDRIAGARHIGRGVLERDVETLIPGKDEPIVLYCGGGFRSALAADNLQRMGYSNVVSMDGGIRAWREAAYAIEKGT